jgi:effector-binding domain-containing protein
MVVHLFISFAILFGGASKENSPAFSASAIFFCDTSRKPSWTLEESVSDTMNLLFIRDTVWTYDSLQVKLGKDYSELFSFIFQHGLNPGKILATYFSSSSPIVFEPAVEIRKVPAQSLGRVRFKKTNGGKVIIAHFQGPYSEIRKAYQEILNFMKAKNKEADGPPFEVYLNDPSSVKDPYDLKTDLYQPIRGN